MDAKAKCQANIEPSFGGDPVEGVTNMASLSQENVAGWKVEVLSIASRALL